MSGLQLPVIQNNEASNRLLTRIGIVQITDDKAHFIHRTFAEYFAADLLAARLVEKEPTPEAWSTFLLKEILLQPEHRVVRSFLEGQLTKQTLPESTLTKYGQRIAEMPRVIGPYDPEETVLHIAFREGHLAISNFLLSSLKEHPKMLKYFVLATDGNHRTALHSAVLSGKGETVTSLLEFVRDNFENEVEYHGTLKSLLLATEIDGRTALSSAAFLGKRAVMNEFLVFAKNNLDATTIKSLMLTIERDGANVLHNAIFSGSAEVLDELLVFAKDNLEPEDLKSWILAVEEDTRNTFEHNKKNTLHAAVLTGKWEIVRKLLSFVENNLDSEVLKSLLEGETSDGKTAQQLIEESEFSQEIKGELRQPFLINNVASLHEEFDHLALESSGTGASCSSMSHRRKRDLGRCQREEAEEEGSRPLFPYDPLDDNVSPEQKRAARLATQSAMAVAWQHPEQLPEATVENSLRYNTYSGDIIQEGSRNHSPREKALLDQHYQEAQNFIRDLPKETLWKNDDSAEPAGEVRRSRLFDNGRYSLLVLYDGQRYQLYSQDFNYHQIFQTRAGVTFSEITAFAQAFFKWRSGSGDYSTFTLQDVVSKNVIEKLQAASFWEPDRIKSDSLLLASEPLPLIEGIPVKAVRALIRLNGEVPDYVGLYPNFFNDQAAQITFRVDQLHKILPTLTEAQRQALVAAVKKHSWLEDKSASNGLSPEAKPLFDSYCQQVIETLTAEETTTITPEHLSELSWNTLSQHFDQHPDSESAEQLKALKEPAIASTQEIHAKASKSAWAKGMATQTLFFLPDMIRSANSGNVDNLAKTGAMVGGDAVINKGYSTLVDGLETVLPEGRAALLRKLPVASPIFKVLTVYSIVELTQQLNTLPADSPERSVIQHKLGEQYVTAGLMVVELLGFEAGPLWIGLIAEQLIFDAITFRKENHLDIPFWEAFIMSLGFEQDKLQGILEERQLVELSLDRVDRSPGTTRNFYGWALVHVPELKNSRWQPLRKDQIPENIIQKIEAQSAPWIYLHDEEKEADGFKEVRHHAESPILAGFEMVFFYRPPNLSVTLHWEQRIYDAVPSCVTVQFSPGTKNYQEDNTFLASPLGSNSHYKKIVSVISPEETSGFNEAETPVVIKNGLGALYVNNKTFSDSSSQRNIHVGFDPREGNMALNFTTEGLRKIDEINRSHNPSYVEDDKSHYMVTIGVGHKPYPNSIIFPSGNGYGIFSLTDSSQRIISQYIISDNNPFQIRDGAAETRIALLSPAVDNDNSTLYTVSGNSSNIKIQKLIYSNTVFNNSIQFNQYRLINENHIELKGIKKYLQLMLNNIIIRDRLVVSAARVDILYAQGIPNNSRITVGEEVLAFNMLLVGNIIVSSGHTQLQLIGKIPKASDPIGYSKMISDNVTSLYTLKIENLEPIINALPRKNPPGFKFTLPGLQLAWNNNDTISKASLRIEGQLEGQKSFLEMQHDVDTLKIFNSTNRLTTVKINHYTPEVVLDNQLELTDILKPYQANFVSNRTAQDVYSDFLKTGSLVTSNITACPMDGHILVFLAPEGHQVFHRFTAPGGINLNGIRYTVHGKEIYAVPGDNGVIEGNQLLHYRRHPNATQLSVVGIQFSGSVGESKISLQNETLAIGNVTLKNLPDDTLFYFGNHSFSMRSLKETLAPRATVGNRTLPSVLRWRRAAPVEVASAHSSGTRLNFWPLKAVTEGLSYLVDWSSHWITLPIAHQAVAPKAPLNNPPDSNTLHCMPGAWVDGGYSGDGITCVGRSGTARVFINNAPQAMNVSGAGPRQIASDNFAKGSCRPIEFNGRPSVYCEGEKTTLVYTPELPPRPFEQWDGQLMLGCVLLEIANKSWKWVQGGMISSPKVAPVLISSEQRQRWVNSLKHLEQSANELRLTLGEQPLQWMIPELEECRSLAQQTTDLPENIECLDERLDALKEELEELQPDEGATDTGTPLMDRFVPWTHPQLTQSISGAVLAPPVGLMAHFLFNPNRGATVSTCTLPDQGNH